MLGRAGRKLFKLLRNVISTALCFKKHMLARQAVVKKACANKRVGRLYLVRRSDGRTVVVYREGLRFFFVNNGN